jgi:hypothetical protein
MMTLALLMAASQVRLASVEVDEMRWRRFVHTAVATETPFTTRMDELRRSVRQLPPARALHSRPEIGGPSGL